MKYTFMSGLPAVCGHCKLAFECILEFLGFIFRSPWWYVTDVSDFLLCADLEPHVEVYTPSDWTTGFWTTCNWATPNKWVRDALLYKISSRRCYWHFDYRSLYMKCMCYKFGEQYDCRFNRAQLVNSGLAFLCLLRWCRLYSSISENCKPMTVVTSIPIVHSGFLLCRFNRCCFFGESETIFLSSYRSSGGIKVTAAMDSRTSWEICQCCSAPWRSRT